MPDSVTLWAAFVGSAAAIAAESLKGITGYFLSGASKIEAQRDSDILRIEAVIFEVRDIAIEYWGLSGSDDGQDLRAGAIIGRMSFVFSLVDGLFAEKIEHQMRIAGYTRIFHEACTDGDFQVKSRFPDPDRARAIEISAYTLVHNASAARRLLVRPMIRLG